MKFVALVPQRESNIQTLLGDIKRLPSIEEGVNSLTTQTIEERHTDLPVDFDKLSMNDNGGINLKLPTDDIQFQYTRHALTQAVARIKPDGVVGMAGYLAACPPDLRSVNFNFWHGEKFGPEATVVAKGDVMLRTRFGEDAMPIIRAIVSQSYVPIDDLPLLKQFVNIIPSGAKIRSARGDIKSRYDVIWPTMKKTLSRGEPLVVAVRLSNSEAGTSSVRLEPIVHGIGLNFNSSIIIPTNAGDVSIRHIGEAGNKLVKRLDNVLQTINPFIEMLEVSYSDFCHKHFDSLDQMYECLKKAFEFNDSVMARVRDNNFEKAVRADLISAIARSADDLPIEDGEYLQRCAGLLAVKGFKLLTKFATFVEE